MIVVLDFRFDANCKSHWCLLDSSCFYFTVRQAYVLSIAFKKCETALYPIFADNSMSTVSYHTLC